MVNLLQKKKLPVKVASPAELPRIFAVVGYAVCTSFVVATFLELASWGGWSAYHRIWPSFPELRQASPVYVGQAWAAEFWQEEHSRLRSRRTYVPFTLWAVPAWHSRHINNDDGGNGAWRRTINPVSSQCAQKHRITVWVFGGSTVYGTGVPDWATMPSYLSRTLNGPGSCTVVRNFGVEGYVSNQELLQLSKRLKTNEPPDVVVFYDGVNDAAAAGASAGAPSAHFYLGTIKSRVEGSISGRLDFVREAYTMQVLEALRVRSHSQRPSELPLGQMQQKATAVLDNYEANLRLAQAFATTFNFELYWFWQPSLYYGHKPRVPFEEHVFEVNASEENTRWSAVVAKVYQEAERRAIESGDFIFLGSIFDHVAEPLYIDEAHLGPRGNELIAQYIARHLQSHSKIYTNIARQY